MNELAKLIGDYETFLSEILSEVKAEGFDLHDFVQIDHLCYRAPTNDRYREMRELLSHFGTFLSENMVNGRFISTFRLHEPIVYDGWRIDALELPAPKPGDEREGLDHIEFVLYDDLHDFLEKYKNKKFGLKAMRRKINPEVSLRLSDKHVVKFHLLSLTTVVFIENQLGYDFIEDAEAYAAQ
ncbi:MAG TPA: VOC family protein [Candidatus Saccharimonadales bacterium]|nr:VOC family protein [Candidatus Saccharimonadales bacterium]